jgi:hypothetical protein
VTVRQRIEEEEKKKREKREEKLHAYYSGFFTIFSRE